MNAVKDLVEAERQHWPPGIEVVFSNDQSRNIRTMLRDLQNNVLSAVLLVMIVVVGALGFRTGFLVGIAIPGSFLTGILVLAAAGLTVNVVVLFSLILSVGLLVDGAIVVTEYADRKMTEGAPRTAAYAEAAKRMGWPIIASTATTLAAFLPLLFWPGMIGEFMKYLPITLIATLSASLLMALIFVPTVGAQIGKPGTAGAAAIAQMKAVENGDIEDIRGVTGAYVRLLKGALGHPGMVAFAAVLALVAAWALYANFGRGFEFFPKVEPNRAVMKVFARGNLSVDQKQRLVGQVEREILGLQRERGEMRAIYILSGEQQRRDNAPADLVGNISIEFDDWRDRRPADEILADIAARSRKLAGIRVETAKEEAGAAGRQADPPAGDLAKSGPHSSRRRQNQDAARVDERPQGHRRRPTGPGHRMGASRRPGAGREVRRGRRRDREHRPPCHQRPEDRRLSARRRRRRDRHRGSLSRPNTAVSNNSIRFACKRGTASFRSATS